MTNTMISVAFQGEIGAFSEQAARSYFEKRHESFELIPLPTFESVFEAVADGRADFAIVPIENSLFGSVHANYDLLQEHDLNIVGELKLRIVHNLLVHPGTTLDQIQQVRSHPQALGQCKHFLQKNLPHAEVIPSYDTAGSAKQLSSEPNHFGAAIASSAAASEYGLEILAAGIESNHQNYTRFLVLDRNRATSFPENARVKTSIVYAMKENVPGALFKSLAVFALRDIDLFKIESRPLVGSPFAYLFYLDFAGSVADLPVSRALDHLSEITAMVRVLGSYVAGNTIEG